MDSIVLPASRAKFTCRSICQSICDFDRGLTIIITWYAFLKENVEFTNKARLEVSHLREVLESSESDVLRLDGQVKNLQQTFIKIVVDKRITFQDFKANEAKVANKHDKEVVTLKAYVSRLQRDLKEVNDDLPIMEKLVQEIPTFSKSMICSYELKQGFAYVQKRVVAYDTHKLS